MLLRTMLLAGAAATLGAMPASFANTIGSGNVAVIEPNVSHPNATPCVVPLVSNVQFTNFTPYSYSYTPPAGCPAPWSKVILKMHLSLNAGVQFDRSGLLFMDGVPLWFGTTAEPDSNLAPNWRFEKDVTDDTALFESAQSGELNIGNLVNSTYTGIITASAELDFYPVTKGWPAPVTADIVLPLPGTGNGTTLNPGQAMTLTTNFPTNVVKADLDLYLQGQSGDEFWYTCVPNSYTSELQSCGGGSVREGEVSVDNQPAGVSPIFPWIFTGGIDPLLWQPIPGVQTLDFIPYTVDLSPFAGELSNGQPHTISVSVFGNNGYFQTNGALRLFLDHGTTQVTGGITEDTLRATPNVITTPNLTVNGSNVTGTLTMADRRNYTIAGTITGSAGTTTYTVSQTSRFRNKQRFNITASDYVQNIDQATSIAETSTATSPSGTSSTTFTGNWPLTVDINFKPTPAGNYLQTTTIGQNYLTSGQTLLNGNLVTQFTLNNTTNSTDKLKISGAGYITGNANQSETANYLYATPTSCFAQSLAASANLLTADTTGCTP